MKVLEELIDKIKEQAAKFASGTSSNICEAVNNEITVYASKRNNLVDTYDIRVNLALLLHNEGPEIMTTIIKQLNLPLSPKITEKLTSKATKKKKKRERRKLETTKAKRVASKTKKKTRERKVTNEEHTYKGGNMPDDKDDGESLAQEPEAKKVRKETDHCGYQALGACKTRRCSCRGSNSKCNDKCKCKDKCNNK